MKLTNIDLNLFLVFDSIYTNRSLTKAAQVLCITQPAVSNALKRLRNALNDPLFIRTPEGMTPTPFAKNTITDVRQALQLLTVSVQEGENFDPFQSKRQINCSMHDLSELLFLPKIIQQLQYNAPNIKVNSYYIPREDVAKELAAGTLDFAIDVPFITNKNLIHQPLSYDTYVVALCKDHPVISNTLTFEQYLSHKHLHVSNRRMGIGSIDIALNNLGHQRTIGLKVKHYTVASQFIEKSNLLWTIPKSLADKLNLNCLPLPFEVPPLESHLFWHENSDKDKANLWLRKMFFRLTTTS